MCCVVLCCVVLFLDVEGAAIWNNLICFDMIAGVVQFYCMLMKMLWCVTIG